jgi:hypothetical protein
MSLALTVFVVAVFAVAALGWVYALYLAVRHWSQRHRAAHHPAPRPAPRRESLPRPTRHPSGRHRRVIDSPGTRSAGNASRSAATRTSAEPPSQVAAPDP